jgi:hypothetical protein
MSKKHRRNPNELIYDSDITKPNPWLKATLLEVVDNQ